MVENVARAGKHLRAAVLKATVGVPALICRVVRDVVSHIEIQEAVTVVVAEDSGRRPSLCRHRRPSRDVCEPTVAVIVVKRIGAVVGHVNVHEPVVVDVAHRHSHAVAGVPQPRLGRDVSKGPVSLLPKKPVGQRVATI